MLTIFEGPDGGGKSQFARWFAWNDPARVLIDPPRVDDHGPYLGESSIAPHYWRSIVGARAGYTVYMDRSWIAEPIYGAAFRGGDDRIGIAYRRMLERGAWSARAVVALFLPPFEVCAESFQRRREEEYLPDTDRLRAVYQGYLGLIEGTRTLDLPCVVVDYTRHRRAQIRDLIAAVRPPVDACGLGAGRFEPGRSILVVGDRPGPCHPERGGDCGAPFVTFQRGGCSVWLSEQLEAAGIPESNLYFINAYSRDGATASPFFLSHLRPPLVVALGERAADWARTVAQVNAVEVPHPQYWRRFHAHDDKSYPLIEEIHRYYARSGRFKEIR